jgi:hypothetical protein
MEDTGFLHYFESDGYKKTIENYDDLISYGWVFQCNVNPEITKYNPPKNMAHSYGVEFDEAVYMTDAFDSEGNKLEGFKALFIR